MMRSASHQAKKRREKSPFREQHAIHKYEVWSSFDAVLPHEPNWKQHSTSPRMSCGMASS